MFHILKPIYGVLFGTNAPYFVFDQIEPYFETRIRNGVQNVLFETNVPYSPTNIVVVVLFYYLRQMRNIFFYPKLDKVNYVTRALYTKDNHLKKS